MSHSATSNKEYRLLQRRLDENVTGAPASPALTKILEILFTPEEAAIARRLPGRPTPVKEIARRLGMPADELDGKLIDMARRGLVLDLELKGRRYALIAPIVVGFFEFTFMRTRDDLPMAELTRLFEEYMTEGGRFARAIFAGDTQIGRSLVHEDALPEGDHTEVLDWERATWIVKNATAVGVSLCACRHKAKLLGKACDLPIENCLTLNFAAESMIRNGLSKSISTDEAMRILEDCKERGLAQTGDNVKQNVSYICNCCKCCCEMMHAVRGYEIKNAIVTSNWMASIDGTKCVGCGLCAKACPVEALDLADRNEPDKKRKQAVVDETLCLGCGVCYSACKSGAIRMKSRTRRVFTPESVFDRTIAMAIERGKLAALIFDDPSRLSHRALGRILHVIEKSPPFKAAMAVQPLRSAFLNALVRKSGVS